MKINLIIYLLFLLLPSFAYSENDFSSILFLDTYSANSKNGIPGSSRPYFTQASKNNDLHINLATAGIKFDNSKYRLNLTGQYGDSVDLNYISEPEDHIRFIQEAYIGHYIDKNTTIDVGSFLAHIGAESWLSKDNINYSRSLIAEYSPYYETGLRLSHNFNNDLSGQFLILNGWQNISDERHPAIGTQLNWETTKNLTLTSNTFIGDENYQTRIFHNLIITKEVGSNKIIGSVDLGRQSDSTWWGCALMAKFPIFDKISLNTRVESYQDKDNIIATTTNGKDFSLYGSSIGLDYNLNNKIFIRSEIKQLYSDKKILLNDNNNTYSDTIFILSLNFLNENKF